jgi:hypothetical protein
VAIARAIERELSLSLRSSLAMETARTFEAADLAIASLDEKISIKWRKYFQLKHAFYMAYVSINSKIPWYPKLLFQRENALAYF